MVWLNKILVLLEQVKSLFFIVIVLNMLTKLNFKLIYFYIMYLDLNVFRQEILIIFRDDKKYNFILHHTYYLNLIDPYGHVLIAIPFKLTSLSDDENIEALYEELYPSLKEFLKYYNRYNISFFIFYIGPEDRKYINFEEMINIRKSMEV